MLQQIKKVCKKNFGRRQRLYFPLSTSVQWGPPIWFNLGSHEDKSRASVIGSSETVGKGNFLNIPPLIIHCTSIFYFFLLNLLNS